MSDVMSAFVTFLYIMVSTSVAVALSPYLVINPTVSTDNLATPTACDDNCYTSSFIKSNISILCGSDGITYLNLEEMDCVRKSCGRDIRLKHTGRCPIRVPTPAPTSVIGTEDESLLLQYLKQIMLQRTQEGMYYRHQKSDQDKFPNYILHLSKQNGVVHEDPALAKKKLSDSAGKGKNICLPDECGCSDELHPICGSDSVTYGNSCLMECNKNCIPDLTKFHDGYCGKIFFKKLCIPDECGCPDDLRPVCGSDNVTYGNRCLLECNKNCNSEFKFAHDGYCGRIFFPTSENSTNVTPRPTF